MHCFKSPTRFEFKKFVSLKKRVMLSTNGRLVISISRTAKSFLHCLDTIVLMICYRVYHNWSDLIPPIFGEIGDLAVLDNLTTHSVCFCTVMSMQISVIEFAFTENNCFDATFQNAHHV
jgi:hypothetical protein